MVVHENSALSAPFSDSEDVLAVIVLFKRKIVDVPCIGRLESWMSIAHSAHCGLRLRHCLIYDNSPTSESCNDVLNHAYFSSVRDPENGGTRAAYLKALQAAREFGCKWILFLDHDTELPEDFLKAAEDALAAASPMESRVCAVVPLIFDGPNAVSPTVMRGDGRTLPWNGESLRPTGGTRLTAISSGAIVRCDSLIGVLPIPTEFALDYLDHWLFYKMQRHSECLAVSSARVSHSLSVEAMRFISIQRYRAVLSAEFSFLSGAVGYRRASYALRLLLRAARLLLTTRRPELMAACLGAAAKVIRSRGAL